ncbi:hypothetical protein V6N13_007964 [Hibiscus sabdariffa]
MVEDTLVPESLEDISSVQVRRMWEGNAREDMRVREVSSTIENWSTDEVAGCIDRLDAANTSVDIVEEAEVFEHRDARLLQSEKQILTNSPDLSVGRRMYGPRSEIARAERTVTKKGCGRPKRNLAEEVANASLSDSDFATRNRGILKEAKEALNLGRLIGADTMVTKMRL